MQRSSGKHPALVLPLLGALLLVGNPGEASSQDLTLTYQVRMEFGGAMGQVLRLMPGMGEVTAPSTTITRISGNRLRSDDGDDTSMIVDAETRQLIQIDHSERSYMVMTPEGMREMAERARERMQATLDSVQADQPGQPTRSEGDAELSVDARVHSERTGRRGLVAGLDAEEWYLTIQADFEVTEEEGADPMFVGSTVAFSDLWLSESVPGGEEQQRIWSAFGEEMARSFDVQDGMDQAFAINPQLRVMFEQNQQAMEEMQGIPVRSTMLMILVPPGIPFDQDRAVADLEGELSRSMGAVAGAVAGEAARGAAAAAARGALGRLGGLRGRSGGDDTPPAEEAPPAPTQTTLMRLVEELQSVSRESIPASVFEVPEGYREITLDEWMASWGS